MYRRQHTFDIISAYEFLMPTTTGENLVLIAVLPLLICRIFTATVALFSPAICYEDILMFLHLLGIALSDTSTDRLPVVIGCGHRTHYVFALIIGQCRGWSKERGLDCQTYVDLTNDYYLSCRYYTQLQGLSSQPEILSAYSVIAERTCGSLVGHGW